MNRERAIAFVVVRLRSHRLFEKHMRSIGDRSLLEWVVTGLKSSGELDGIVLATTEEPENDPLEGLAHTWGVGCYRFSGDPEAITTRLRRAAESCRAELCVMVSGDCPLVDGAGLDFLIRELRDSPDTDILDLRRPNSPLSCSMQGVSVARLRCWQLADDLSDSAELRQHQFPVISEQQHRFKCLLSSLPEEYFGPPRRLCVDTWADLEFMNCIHERLTEAGGRFQLRDAMALLRREPNLVEINAHVYQRSITDREQRVLFVVDAGDPMGFGHLMRCRELALQLVELTGREALFLVDDPQAVRHIEERGLRTEWGALGRPVRAAPDGIHTASAEELASTCDFVVLDLFGKSDLQPGWRERFSPPVMVLDRSESWASEADLVVIPGVTHPESQSLPMKLEGTDTPLFGGADFIILRREIRRISVEPSPRDLDVLAYLHHKQRRDELRSFCAKNDLTVHLLEGQEDRFPSLLARSRLFVSGFGISFYEALALGTQPVVWPLSDDHARDALRFFSAFGIRPAMIDDANGFDQLLTLLEHGEPAPTPIEDGTHRIVELMERSMNSNELPATTKGLAT